MLEVDVRLNIRGFILILLGDDSKRLVNARNSSTSCFLEKLTFDSQTSEVAFVLLWAVVGMIGVLVTRATTKSQSQISTSKQTPPK